MDTIATLNQRPPSTTQLAPCHLEGIVNKDEQAMRHFYNQYSDQVYSYVLSRCGDTFIAWEILNEVMLDVWRQAESFQGRSKVTTWLIGIARHKLVDHYRKENRHQHDFLDEAIPDPTPISEQVLETAQQSEWVKSCINKLVGVHREILHLTFYSDLSYHEIADIIDCPVGTVKSRMFHARELLRRCLESQSNRRNHHVPA